MSEISFWSNILLSSCNSGDSFWASINSSVGSSSWFKLGGGAGYAWDSPGLWLYHPRMNESLCQHFLAHTQKIYTSPRNLVPSILAFYIHGWWAFKQANLSLPPTPCFFVCVCSMMVQNVKLPYPVYSSSLANSSSSVSQEGYFQNSPHLDFSLNFVLLIFSFFPKQNLRNSLTRSLGSEILHKSSKISLR